MEGGVFQEEPAGAHLIGVGDQQLQGKAQHGEIPGQGDQKVQSALGQVENLAGGKAVVLAELNELGQLVLHIEGEELAGEKGQKDAYSHKRPVAGFEVGAAGFFESGAVPHNDTSLQRGGGCSLSKSHSIRFSGKGQCPAEPLRFCMKNSGALPGLYVGFTPCNSRGIGLRLRIPGGRSSPGRQRKGGVP